MTEMLLRCPKSHPHAEYVNSWPSGTYCRPLLFLFLKDGGGRTGSHKGPVPFYFKELQMMDTKQMIEFLMSGGRPEIEFVHGIEDMEGADPGMRGKITSVREDDLDCALVEINLQPYEDHNRAVAIKDWDSGKHTWFDSGFYPKDGQWSFFIDTSGKYPLPLRWLSEKSNRLMLQYITEKPGTSYVEWLESKIP